jgi:RHS repeat-associated protein
VQTIAYCWDQRDRLTSVTYKNAAGTVTEEVDFTYDVYNNRLSKTVVMGDAAPQVERFIYDGSQVLVQLDGSNNETHRYIFGPAVDQVLADQTPDGMDWLLADDEGSIHDLVDAATNRLIEHISYDAFGQPTVSVPIILGDMNGDGVFNNFDLAAMDTLVYEGPAAYVAEYGLTDYIARGDLNHDGQVNEVDLSVLSSKFLTGGSGAFDPGILGDMNGDGVLSQADVVALELAISDPAAYLAKYGLTDYLVRGDLDYNGMLNANDVAILTAMINAETVPELFGYTGQVYDPETGLNYDKARYYDPSEGRFLSPDPIAAESNLYGYANNSPIGSTDPSGLVCPEGGGGSAGGVSMGVDYTAVVGASETFSLPTPMAAPQGPWYYHGTSDPAATNLLNNGLSLEVDAYNPVEQPVLGFYVTQDLSVAASYAASRQAALGLDGPGTIVGAPDSAIGAYLTDPLKFRGGAIVYVRPDQGEAFIAAKYYDSIAPDVFQIIDPGTGLPFRPVSGLGLAGVEAASAIPAWATLGIAAEMEVMGYYFQYYDPQQYVQYTLRPLEQAAEAQIQACADATWIDTMLLQQQAPARDLGPATTLPVAIGISENSGDYGSEYDAAKREFDELQAKALERYDNPGTPQAPRGEVLRAGELMKQMEYLRKRAAQQQAEQSEQRRRRRTFAADSHANSMSKAVGPVFWVATNGLERLLQSVRRTGWHYGRRNRSIYCYRAKFHAGGDVPGRARRFCGRLP